VQTACGRRCMCLSFTAGFLRLYRDPLGWRVTRTYPRRDELCPVASRQVKQRSARTRPTSNSISLDFLKTGAFFLFPAFFSSPVSFFLHLRRSDRVVSKCSIIKFSAPLKTLESLFYSCAYRRPQKKNEKKKTFWSSRGRSFVYFNAPAICGTPDLCLQQCIVGLWVFGAPPL